MIILITGNYGVGKDTFADILLQELHKQNINAGKILSYTTRPIRDDNDLNNHLFTKKYHEAKSIVVEATIAGEHYWTEKEQFCYENNLYVIDEKSIQKILDSKIDDFFIIKIIRKDSLIDISKNRKNRENREALYSLNPYIIENNRSLNDLKQKALNLISFLFTSE